MRDLWGYRVYVSDPSVRVERRWLTAPRVAHYRIRVLVADRFHVYTHVLGKGWVWSAWGPGGRTAVVTSELPYQWRWMMAVIRRSAPDSKVPPPALPAPMAVLVNSPLLAEHLVATKYDDGLIRTPGSFKVENLGTAWRVTVYDHDAGLRLAVPGPTLEESLEQVEVLLGATDAPWEVDRYLSEQAARRKKAKK